MDFQKKFILKRDDASMDKDDNQVGFSNYLSHALVHYYKALKEL